MVKMKRLRIFEMSSVCTVWTVFTVLYVTFCNYIERGNVSISLEMLPVTLFYREQVPWAT